MKRENNMRLFPLLAVYPRKKVISKKIESMPIEQEYPLQREKEILAEIKKLNKKWSLMRNSFNTIVVILGVIAIITSIIVSVYTGANELIKPENLKIIAVISTSCLALLTAFNVVGMSNDTIKAWRHLNVAILKYEGGIYSLKQLIEAYKESEQIMGQLNFNYSSAHPSDNNNNLQNQLSGNQLANDFSNKDLIEKAIQEIKDKKDDRIIGVGYLPKLENGLMKYYLHLNVKDETTKKEYEDNYTVKNSSNQNIKPPMSIIVTNEPKTQANKLPGTGIRNSTGKNGDGTFGCVVKDNETQKNCILSCQHVLKDNTDFNNMNDNTTIKLTDGSNDDFGIHLRGLRDHEIDAGIAFLNNQAIDNKNLGVLKGERDTTDNDVVINKRVIVKGFDLDAGLVIPQFGVIINNGFDVDLDYEDGNPKFTIQDTIVLSESNSNFKAISKPGYSGAIVIDEDRFVIGIVVGGDDKFTYAIPINKTKTKLNFSILK